MLKRFAVLCFFVALACANPGPTAPAAEARAQTGTPPSVDFTWICDAPSLTCAFTDQIGAGTGSILYAEYNPSGGLVGWHSFNPPAVIVHEFDFPGLFQVDLTAFASDGLAATKTRGVYLPSIGDTFPFILQGYTYRVKGKRQAALLWANGAGATVSLYRNGVLIASTENDGYYLDAPGHAGTYTYRVCDGSICAPDLVLVAQ